jgi:uncharacterized cupredoxin-like copper-binding protein
MDKFRGLTWACVLVVSALLISACGASTASTGSGSAAKVTLEASDAFKFVPNTITVTPRQVVELTLVNTGKLDHTFVVPDLNIKYSIPAGKTVKETFTAPAAGKHQFYCDEPGHKEAGMVGTLMVKP